MVDIYRVTDGRTKRLAVVAATAVTAMTIASTPPTPPALNPFLPPRSMSNVNLSSYTSLLPPPGVWPDLTFGIGTSVYNFGQTVINAVAPPIVNAIHLGGISGLTGANLLGLLNQIPQTLLPQVLNAVPIPLTPLLDHALGTVITATLTPVLEGLGIMDSSGNVSLDSFLGLLGIDIADLTDLSDVTVPGVKVITAGPVFSLLKMLGVDLGWTPGTEIAVANAINNTLYLAVDASTLINIVLDQAAGVPALDPLVTALKLAIAAVGLPAESMIDVRVPLSIAWGLGAFSAGQAYSKVLADLPNQPGGTAYTGTSPLLGSMTILPEVLLNNLGRANGGLLARFYPFGDLVGINTVTPDVSAAHSGGIAPLLDTGLAVGGANLLPIKVDATLEYQPFSDFAAWPNLVSLLNNLIAGTVPTYLLRGISTDTLTVQLTTALEGITASALAGNPLAANIYLTVPTATLPLLEPLYLVGDALNMIGGGMLGGFAYKLANALAPVLTSLVNLGYTDVVRNADGTYSRTLDQAATPVPFFSFPNLDWRQVPGDLINSLITGLQKEFFSGSPTAAPPNAIEGAISLLTGGTSNTLVGLLNSVINNIVNSVTGLVSGLVPAAAKPTAAVAAVATVAAVAAPTPVATSTAAAPVVHKPVSAVSPMGATAVPDPTNTKVPAPTTGTTTATASVATSDDAKPAAPTTDSGRPKTPSSVTGTGASGRTGTGGKSGTATKEGTATSGQGATVPKLNGHPKGAAAKPDSTTGHAA